MFKGASSSFLVVGFFIIVFLFWLVIANVDFSSSEVEEDDKWLEEMGLSVNIWPDGEPEKEKWQEILSDCKDKTDMLSKARCSYVLGEIDSFEDCAVAGFSIMESDPEQCETSDGRVFVNQ